MSGFFKKLFNRIIGKKEETPPAAETPALPPPEAPVEVAAEPLREPETAPEPVIAPPPPPPPPPPREQPRPKAEEPKPKKPEPKKPEPKAPEKKKPEAKKPPSPATPAGKGKPKPEPVTIEASAPVEAPPPVRIEAVAPPPPPPPPSPPPPTEAAPVETVETEAPARRGWLSRLKHGLSKSSQSITSSITSIFTKRKLDRATLGELEDVLIQADLGLPVAERIIAAVAAGRYDREIEPDEVKRILAAEVEKVLKPVEIPFNFGSEKPFVILVVGVNGSGKTTTIGKLGAIAKREGFSVMFAACDTFRAAAIEQLTVWGSRIGARTVSRPTGADASGLAFDAMAEAQETATDILFIDTAGRLQNKAYLMDELDKIVRVIRKKDAAAPHAVLLVLDATTGQNALAQADVFTKVAGVTGLIMTKLDGTARGGILVAIAEKFRLPVHAIGVGETIDDLQAFDAGEFARAIAGLEDA